MPDDTNIPVLGENANLPDTQEHPFPEFVEPGDKDWWLTEDQKAVCDSYLGDCHMNAVEAWKKHRNTRTTKSAQASSSRFFCKPKVRRYLYFKTKKLAKKVELTQEKILSDLIEVKEMAMGRKPTYVMATDKHGNIFQDYVHVANLSVAKQTLEQLGKFYKLSMWTEKADTEINNISFSFNMGAPEKKGNVIDHENDAGKITHDNN